MGRSGSEGSRCGLAGRSGSEGRSSSEGEVGGGNSEEGMSRSLSSIKSIFSERSSQGAKIPGRWGFLSL